MGHNCICPINFSPKIRLFSVGLFLASLKGPAIVYVSLSVRMAGEDINCNGDEIPILDISYAAIDNEDIGSGQLEKLGQDLNKVMS